MGWFDTDLGKLLLFMIFGMFILVALFGFSKSPKAAPSVAGAHSARGSTSSRSQDSSNLEEYTPEPY